MGVEDTALEDDPIAAFDVVESESEDAGPRKETAVDGRKIGLALGEVVLPLPGRLGHRSEFPFDGDFGSSPGLGGTITEATAPATLLSQPLPGLMGLKGEV